MSARKLFYFIIEFSEGIEALVALSDQARREGLLSLEDRLDRFNPRSPFDQLVKMGLVLAIDGTDPELVSRVLEHYSESYLTKLQYRWNVWENLLQTLEDGQDPAEIRAFLDASLLAEHPENTLLQTVLSDVLTDLADGEPARVDLSRWPPEFRSHPLTGSCLRLMELRGRIPEERRKAALANHFHAYRDLFVKMSSIAIEGVLSIQAGDSPRITRSLLSTLEGHDILQIRLAGQEGAAYEPRSEDYAEDELPGDEYGAGPMTSMAFADVFLQLDFRSVQRLLREIEPDDLARALVSVSPEIRELVFSNLSVRAAERLRELMEWNGAVSAIEVRESQASILGILRELQASGEIAISDQDE